VIDTGVCTNLKCPRGASGEPIERYPGPGQYCPDCGEMLQPSPYSAPVRSAKPARGRRVALIAVAAFAVLALVGAGIVFSISIAPSYAVRVCSTSATDRAVNAILREYTRHNSVWPFRYAVTRPGDLACDVRFRIAFSGPEDSVIASDGIVAVVNPQNPTGRLGIAQLNDILTGRIVDWSEVGKLRGPVLVLAPADGSDEANVLAGKIVGGRSLGSHVVRDADSSHIVRMVSSPSGLRSIGIVPFSVASPAKVLALGDAPPPSPLSIGDGRYPLSVRIIAESDFRYPRSPASKLLAYVRSADAGNLLARATLVSKNGP
jgi:PBP superfamily domain